MTPKTPSQPRPRRLAAGGECGVEKHDEDAGDGEDDFGENAVDVGDGGQAHCWPPSATLPGREFFVHSRYGPSGLATRQHGDIVSPLMPGARLSQ